MTNATALDTNASDLPRNFLSHTATKANGIGDFGQAEDDYQKRRTLMNFTPTVEAYPSSVKSKVSSYWG